MNERGYLITLTGIVQGVGFRPFVFRIATMLGLKGWVENCGGRVIIHVQGQEKQVSEFIDMLHTECPAQAMIIECSLTPQPLTDCSCFFIKNSGSEQDAASFVAPDIAVCRSCLAEMETQGALRQGYPFISCTDCGPRYSIISRLPYDRENTTMDFFTMCSHCADEYKATDDRRFHAQTNCCPNCGPSLRLLDTAGSSMPAIDIFAAARELLRTGKILAVKGIGGYHLCCDAQNAATVELLRIRKRRPHKPLAIMAKNLEAVNKICTFSKLEAEILTGSKKPILLLSKKEPSPLPDQIAPNQNRLGVMLPYAPLHPLLFPDKTDYLVMTSANMSGCPICYQENTLSLLAGIADCFLVHDRDILIPVDDAVAKVTNEQERLLRCGRGYAPITLSLHSSHAILALGAQQKSTLCIASGAYAALSQHLGDLHQRSSYRAFAEQAAHFKQLFNVNPQIYAHDLSQDYLSTRYANAQGGQTIAVQHHHAHMAGCMAENSLDGAVIGIIFDGTGLGTDGSVWGGEFLVGTRTDFYRAGHLQAVTLQGGDNVVQQPWRCAVAYLSSIGIAPYQFLPDVPAQAQQAVLAALEHNIQCVASSSMGRLFDCAAALCGFQTAVTYESQAAIEFESLLDETFKFCYRYQIDEQDVRLILRYEKILNDLLEDIQKGTHMRIISAKFHNTIIQATADCASKIANKTGLKTVVLSGGVFDNSYLLEGLMQTLRSLDLCVYCNRLTPANDGGIAFGQAAVAAAIMEENEYVSCDSCKNS